MKKHYDILQIRDIRSAIGCLADEINMSNDELSEILNLETLGKIIDFLAYCGDKNYSATRILSRKLNDIAIQNNAMIRFAPAMTDLEKRGIMNGIYF